MLKENVFCHQVLDSKGIDLCTQEQQGHFRPYQGGNCKEHHLQNHQFSFLVSVGSSLVPFLLTNSVHLTLTPPYLATLKCIVAHSGHLIRWLLGAVTCGGRDYWHQAQKAENASKPAPKAGAWRACCNASHEYLIGDHINGFYMVFQILYIYITCSTVFD